MKTSVLRGWAAGVLAFTSVIGSFIAATPSRAETMTIVALGASNTRGKGVAPEQAYPAQLEALLRERQLDVRVLNAGVNGNTTGDMLARVDPDVPDGTRLVILQPGGNDAYQGLGEQRQGNIDKIVSHLNARKIEVVIVENDVLGSLPREHLQPDGAHYTPEGYRLLALKILPKVTAALGQKEEARKE